MKGDRMHSAPRSCRPEGPKKVVFLSGTRADFGKIKPLIQGLEDDPRFDVSVFATGMHMQPKYGFTVTEIEKSGFEVYRYINQAASPGVMDRALGHTVLGFGDYVRLIEPDLIVVHGDRSEALAGALVGALNNVLVAHVEGGEVSGTVDELMRHAISKLAHLHFVSNEEAKQRLIQLGEGPERIEVIGSPDIDVMSSPDLPPRSEAFAHYELPDWERYGILTFHPVTTALDTLQREARAVFAAAKESGLPFVVVYPNNDAGSDIVLGELLAAADPSWCRAFPSIRFEYMLVLLREATLIYGNSSMGIHEAPYYGVPTINIGTRQNGRSHNPHILHTPAQPAALQQALHAAQELHGNLEAQREFGDGKSHKRFLEALSQSKLWRTPLQKEFRDLPRVSLTPPSIPPTAPAGEEAA